jgi:hypothetical protein
VRRWLALLSPTPCSATTRAFPALLALVAAKTASAQLPMEALLQTPLSTLTSLRLPNFAISVRAVVEFDILFNVQQSDMITCFVICVFSRGV